MNTATGLIDVVMNGNTPTATNKGREKSVWAIIQRSEELMKGDRRFTRGYALYNALCEVDMVTARGLVHTPNDPALDERNIDRFLAHLCFRFGLL